jgi:hypothetical protein
MGKWKRLGLFGGEKPLIAVRDNAPSDASPAIFWALSDGL